MSIDFIAVSGYGYSGSSAVVDLLREFKNYKTLDFEFRLVKDPHGIIDLECFLVDNWDVIRNDAAIKDFLSFSKVLDREDSRYFQRGFDYKHKLKGVFSDQTKIYINNLTDVMYSGNTMVFDYKLLRTSFLLKRLKRKIFRKDYKQGMYLSRPSKDKFVYETKLYLENIFSKFATDQDSIILDQCIPTSNIKKSLNYFNNIKLIIIDRDPRDVYMELMNQNSLIGAELRESNNIEKYIKWFKTTRESEDITDAIILKISFEDLILDYANTVETIKEFLGTNVNHKYQYKFLNPEVSRNNIKLWKAFPDQDVMNKIYRELAGYCYKENSLF